MGVMAGRRDTITLEQALEQAIITASTIPPTHRLINVSFGRFTAPEVEGGAYWTMGAIRDYGNTASVERQTHETFEQRLPQVMTAYRAQVDKEKNRG
jgi:hypothetical protein